MNDSLPAPSGHTRLYRTVALLGLMAALLSLLLVTQHMVEPEEWSLRFAVQNLAQGHLTVSDSAYHTGVEAASAQGVQVQQYVQTASGQWAFDGAPGYIFFLLPFQASHVPGLGNILLFLALAVATYILLARLKNERLAALGTLLLIFTPALLEMTLRPYMNSLAALAFPSLGGIFYILFFLLPEGDGRRPRGVLLTLAGLFLASGVAVSYGNGLIALVFLMHFGLTRMRRQDNAAGREALLLGLGALLPLLGLALYQWNVFGSPFSYGYQLSPAPPRFAFDYLGTGHAWQIIRGNFMKLWVPLLIAFPILMPALSSVVLLAWGSLSQRLPGIRARIGEPAGPALPRHLLWLLGGWLLAVYGLYLMYEWTAGTLAWNLPYIVLTRFYLPGLLPLAVFSAVLVERMPARLRVSVTASAIALGLLFFVMAASTSVVFQGPTVTETPALPQAMRWPGFV